MLTWLKQNLLGMFFRVPLLLRISDEQHQTDIDLLSAAHNAEERAACFELGSNSRTQTPTESGERN